jgi:hypothetical protein
VTPGRAAGVAFIAENGGGAGVRLRKANTLTGIAAYAHEMAWREDHRRISNGEQYLILANSALAHPVSRQWKGYWQHKT